MPRRGDVYLTDVDLPSRADGRGGRRRKYVVALQDDTSPHFRFSEDLAVVVCSSVTSLNPDRLRLYEVGIRASGELFPNDTVVDCRWPFTLSRAGLPRDAEFRLPAELMQEVDDAILHGLGIVG